MLSVSPSIAASYEYWRSMDGDEDASDARLAELIGQIKGDPFERSAAMVLGEAFHAGIEIDPAEYRGQETVTVLAHEFRTDGLRAMHMSQPKDLVRELPGTLVLPEIDVVMRLRVDGISGLTVHEVKTTSRIDPDRYLDALQWRCYLLAFGAQECIYHLCRILRDRKTGVCELAEYVPMRQFAHPGMRETVVRRVGEVAQFIREQGLAKYREMNLQEVELCA